MDSKLNELYLEFRDKSLNVVQTENIRARIKTLIREGKTGYWVLELGVPDKRYRIYLHISEKLSRIDLLGGHWSRVGEPELSFRERIDRLLAEIAREENNGNED